MTTNFKPNSKGFIMGTEGDDEIIWQESWDKAITVNAIGGNDTLNFSQSTYNNSLIGGTGNDTIYGGSGNDTLIGDAGEDYIDGGLGDDVLYGGADNNTLKGQSGNDSIFGGINDDRIYGGNGHDTILGGDGNDVIFGDSGQDILRGGNGNDTITGGAGGDSIDGGDGDDSLYGSFGRNTINAAQGNDLVCGGENTDIIYAGTGDDTILGGAGNDIIYGESGNNDLKGNEGHDVIYGGSGNDTIRGGEGDDTLLGGDGKDTIRGEYGNNTIKGNAGDDFLVGGTGNDIVDGGEGNDIVYGIQGTNTLKGKEGNDTIFGGTGIDKIYGGEGDDSIYGGEGNDKIYGEAGNDTLYGGEGNDIITGGEDDDIINGDNGDDYLSANSGNDTLIGGSGNDTFVFDSSDGSNTITDAENADTLRFTTDNFANLEFSRDLTTNDLIISNETGTNVTVTDFFDGNNVDKVVANDEEKSILNDATINVSGLSDYQGTEYNENIQLVSGTVNENDDVLHGNIYTSNFDGQQYTVNAYANGGAGNDVVTGTDDGNDWINGGEGNDTIIGGNSGHDMISGGDGNDVIMGHASNTIGSEYYGGNGKDQITGSGGDDFIHGGQGNDIINLSKGGSDTVTIAGEDANFKETIQYSDANDTLKLTYNGQGYNFSDLTFERQTTSSPIPALDKDNLVIKTNTDNGQIVIDNFFKNDSKLDKILAIDGYTHNPDEFSILQDADINVADTSDFRGTEYSEVLHLVKGTVNEQEDVLNGNTYTSNADGNDYTVDAFALGGGGADQIWGTDGNDWINGGDGNDHIHAGTSGHDMISGGDGNDVIMGHASNTIGSEYYGGNGKDQITGSGGDDFIHGGQGNDIINLSKGGSDTVTIAGEDANFKETIQYSDANDTLKLTYNGQGYNFSDLTFERQTTSSPIPALDKDNLVIKTNTDNGQIVIDNFFKNNSKLDNIITTDGNKSILADATVNVALENGATYTATGYNENLILSSGNTNTLVLTENAKVNITMTGVTEGSAVLNNGTLTISDDENEGTLIIQNYLQYGEGNVTFSNGTITNAALEDVIWSSAKLPSPLGENYDVFYKNAKSSVTAGVAFEGTFLADYINGTTSADTISGGAGRDHIVGKAENDIITGGDGNDYLSGDAGNDTYINTDLNYYDQVYDSAGDDDCIYITGVNKDDLILYFDLEQDGGSIVAANSKKLYISNNGDFGAVYADDADKKGISVSNYFTSLNYNIERIETADGYYMTTTQINSLRESTAGWLADNGFTSIQQIVDSGDEANINALIAQLKTADWQQMV